ncbi:MAG: hypothetical protein HGA75_11920 [Thiobacillus sp.]|nr:hypothetical protein [Thiobacillus sp.]
MIIQSGYGAQAYSGIASASARRQDTRMASAAIADPAKIADRVSLSSTGKALAASLSSATAGNDMTVDERLAAIKAKDALSRTQEEQNYVLANDKRLAEITAQGKAPERLTAEELDYMQKAGGFVNTMANLSPAEKALYDKAVASGDTGAVAGFGQIALIRMMGHTAGGANGTTYDPLDTEITVANIQKYFSYSIVDPTGTTQSQLHALMKFLQDNQTG